MKNNNFWKILYIISMILYGTTGCIARFILVSPGLLIASRSVIGVLFILLFMLITRKKMDKEGIKKNLLWLILGGVSIGFNWIFLFKAYSNTTVANASLINYLAPAIFILITPILFKEHFAPFKLIFVFLALVGVIFVSGVFDESNNFTLSRGIIEAIFAAIGYVGILIFNKKQKDVAPYDKVIIQLSVASLFIIPYAILTTDFSEITVDLKMVLLILLFGTVLTGVAYIFYLGSMNKIPSLNVVMLSYIEPVTSVLLSVLILHEKLSIYGIIGGLLILGSTFICEILKEKKKEESEVPD